MSVEYPVSSFSLEPNMKKGLEQAVKTGKYANVSHAVRVAIKNFLQNEGIAVE